MATSKSQRIGIIIIAAIMVVGTIGSFAVLILANQNDQQEYARQQAAYAEYQKEFEAYNLKLQAQASALSKKYYPEFSKYADRPEKFPIDSVEKLETDDLKEGDGVVIDDDTKFAAYYIGWNPDGKIFDQSIDGDSLKSPLPVESGLAAAGLIEGWKQGMKGMKIGGVRIIEIPSDLAYGEAGSGDDIPPNSPIKFVVMAIELPESIEQPELPASLQGGL